MIAIHNFILRCLSLGMIKIKIWLDYDANFTTSFMFSPITCIKYARLNAPKISYFPKLIYRIWKNAISFYSLMQKVHPAITNVVRVCGKFDVSSTIFYTYDVNYYTALGTTCEIRNKANRNVPKCIQSSVNHTRVLSKQYKCPVYI